MQSFFFHVHLFLFAISKQLGCFWMLFTGAFHGMNQVPFTLEQQRRIVSVLNTLVYNALSHGISQQNMPLMDAAIRCLHLLYERDCRHQFCHPALWLSPAKKNRPPIAVAARTHEVLSATIRSDDALTLPKMGSVITTTPHVFPFEERCVKLNKLIHFSFDPVI